MDSEKDLSWGASVSPQGYEFTLNSSGQVSAMAYLFGTRTFNLDLPANATFTTDSNAGTVTETLTGKYANESIVYTAETPNASLYQVTQETLTVDTPSTTTSGGYVNGYSFTIASGQVTAMQAVFGSTGSTHTFTLNSSPDTVFSVSGTTVTETSIHGNAVETIQFVQPANSTLYAVSSETVSFITEGSATTALSVEPYERAEFTIGSGGAVTQVQAVSPSGTLKTVTPDSHTTFVQLAAGFVEETYTNGTHSSFALFYEGGSNGIYTEIAHGSGTTVDLVGIQAQLAQLSHLSPALAALV